MKIGSQKRSNAVSRVVIYAVLILITALMLIPFIWMLSASLKMNKDVFSFPIKWIMPAAFGHCCP